MAKEDEKPNNPDYSSGMGSLGEDTSLEFNGEKVDTGTGNAYSNSGRANAVIQQQEANKAKNAEALVRMNANNMAQANMQVGQAGLQGQGAGNAITQDAAQQNAQNAANFMLESNEADAKAQAEAASIAEEDLQKATDHYWTLVRNGQLDEADAWSKQHNLGLSTSGIRYGEHEEIVNNKILELENRLEASSKLDPITKQAMQDELAHYKRMKTQLAEAKAKGIDFSQIVGDILKDPKSFSEPYNKMTHDEIKAYDTIVDGINELLTLQDGKQYLGNIEEALLKKYGYNSMHDFWNFDGDNSEHIKEFGKYVGLLLRGLQYGTDNGLDLSPEDRAALEEFLADDSLAEKDLKQTKRDVDRKEIEEKWDTMEKAAKYNHLKSLPPDTKVNLDGKPDNNGAITAGQHLEILRKLEEVKSTINNVSDYTRGKQTSRKDSDNNYNERFNEILDAVNGFKAYIVGLGISVSQKDAHWKGKKLTAYNDRAHSWSTITDLAKFINKMFGGYLQDNYVGGWK